MVRIIVTIVVTQRRGGRAGKWRLVHVNGRGRESLLVPYINLRGRGENNIAFRSLPVKGKQFGGGCDHRLGKGCRTLKPGGGGGLTNEVVVGGRARPACVVCLGFQSERLCSLLLAGNMSDRPRKASSFFVRLGATSLPPKTFPSQELSSFRAPISSATIGFRRRSSCLLCPPPTPTRVAYVSLSPLLYLWVCLPSANRSSGSGRRREARKEEGEGRKCCKKEVGKGLGALSYLSLPFASHSAIAPPSAARCLQI